MLHIYIVVFIHSVVFILLYLFIFSRLEEEGYKSSHNEDDFTNDMRIVNIFEEVTLKELVENPKERVKVFRIKLNFVSLVQVHIASFMNMNFLAEEYFLHFCHCQS